VIQVVAIIPNPVDVPRHIQIRTPVVVVVAPDRTDGVIFPRVLCVLRDLCVRSSGSL
jgi:hypothetical protein